MAQSTAFSEMTRTTPIIKYFLSLTFLFLSKEIERERERKERRKVKNKITSGWPPPWPNEARFHWWIP